MKYLAQVTIFRNGTNQGCYRFNSDSLDAIRDWAKSVGKSGDELMIVRNGDTLANARKLTI